MVLEEPPDKHVVIDVAALVFELVVVHAAAEPILERCDAHRQRDKDPAVVLEVRLEEQPANN